MLGSTGKRQVLVMASDQGGIYHQAILDTGYFLSRYRYDYLRDGGGVDYGWDRS